MHSKHLAFAAGVVAFLAAVVPIRAQQARTLEITFNDGRVSLVAENVTLRDILQEWSRQGGSTFVNADKITGGPMVRTEFTNQPEAEVMASLLRELPGYGASMRPVTGPGRSAVGTVYLIAVRAVAPITSSYSQPAAPVVAPVVDPSASTGSDTGSTVLVGSPDNEIPPVRQLFEGASPATPGAPQQAPLNPNLRVLPGGAIGSTVPGTIIPVQPASGNPTTPPAGRGRGGGGGGVR